jgi:hypothetical protein
MQLHAAPRGRSCESGMIPAHLSARPPAPIPDTVPAAMLRTDPHSPPNRRTQQDWHPMSGQRGGVVCLYLAPDARHTSEVYKPDKRRARVYQGMRPAAQTDDTALWSRCTMPGGRVPQKLATRDLTGGMRTGIRAGSSTAARKALENLARFVASHASNTASRYTVVV